MPSRAPLAQAAVSAATEDDYEPIRYPRPTKAIEEQLCVRRTVRLKLNEAVKLHDLARTCGLSVSEVVRALIERAHPCHPRHAPPAGLDEPWRRCRSCGAATDPQA